MTTAPAMNTAGDIIQDVRNLVVLRPNALGDFMFALPALHALRQAYPAAHITLLGKAWHADFLHGRPGPVDEVIVMPLLPGVGAPPRTPVDIESKSRLMLTLGALNVDVAIQMYGGGRHSNAFIKDIGARVTIGSTTPGAATLDRSIHYGERVNRRLELLQIAALAGAQPRLMTRELEVTASDRELAERLLPRQAGERLVIIHPGASDPRRCWLPARFAAVADVLAAEGATIIISASAAEATLAESVASQMRHTAATSIACHAGAELAGQMAGQMADQSGAPISPAAIDLAGRLPLPALCGLLERATLIVSNDTGPLHLALALGKPAVGIFWLTNMIESCPLAQHLLRPALSTRIHCPVCGVENLHTRCPHDVSFVDDVREEEVIFLATELFRSLD